MAPVSAEPGLPSWFTQYRPHQQDAISEVVDGFRHNDIVVLDAPTGTGKTLIAESARQLLGVRGLYLCSTLSLQDQFAHDFPHCAVLRGRANYPTLDDPERFDRRRDHLSAADCDKRKTVMPGCRRCPDREGDREELLHCSWCHPVRSCPYQSAKAHALQSSLVCSNTSYFLYEANYYGDLSHQPFIIVDECDLLEETLMSFIQVHVPKRTAAKYEIEAPSKKTKEDSWIAWADTAHQRLRDRLRRESRDARSLESKRSVAVLRNLVQGLARLTDPTHGIRSGGWVYTGYNKGDITFKPITVDRYAADYLWRHGNKWLLMSATVISTSTLLASLGVGSAV